MLNEIVKDEQVMQVNKIHILSDFLANQIAAGEVVQRPESVVKELIENGLDADANHIAVFIKDAGKSLIQIIDNGTGMSKDDLLLATVRHATSKIRTQDDLTEIKTFGFRGEALPSISSVSLLEIKTKQKDNPTGWKLITEPMQKDFKTEEIAMENGTQISVRNLFYNVPARRKFLKSNTTELKHINETILKFALAHPNVRFIYYNNDSLVFDVKPQPLKDRINTMLGLNGGELDEPILPIEYSMNDINISGYIGHPQLAKKTNNTQYFFLNGRSINSKMLSFAVFNGMEHLLDKGMKPLFVLNIKLDYKAVDVNVHPQKSEVKFEDEQLIYSIIKSAVQNAFRLDNIISKTSNNLSDNDNLDKINIINEKGENENILVNRNTGEIHSINNSGSLRYEKLIGKTSNPTNPNYNLSNYSYNKNISKQDFNYTKQLENNIDLLYSNNILSLRHTDQVSTFPVVEGPLSQVRNEIQKPDLDVKEFMLENLWQYHNKYILLQTEMGLLAIDQHNAHERIIYEKLISNVENSSASKQGLLFDTQINLNSMQMLIIKEIENELKNLGFEFELKNNEVTITAQPTEINIGSVEVSFVEIINDYNSNEELKHIPKQERLIATISCKSAIKAGQKLSTEEMKFIVLDLLKCKMQYVCPHGRPIVVSFPISEWDKKFGRI